MLEAVFQHYFLHQGFEDDKPGLRADCQKSSNYMNSARFPLL